LLKSLAEATSGFWWPQSIGYQSPHTQAARIGQSQPGVFLGLADRPGKRCAMGQKGRDCRSECAAGTDKVMGQALPFKLLLQTRA
jgi:hypothetical protein